MTGLLPAFKQTSLWKRGRALKRRLLPPANAPHAPVGTLTLHQAPPALELGQTILWTLTATNTGPDPWPARGHTRLSAIWFTPAGDPLGSPQSLPLPAPVFARESLTFSLGITAPEFVGDFTLELNLPGCPPLRTPVPVVGRRATDIDYHSVYRTANLAENHWWVVGGYYSREEYERSSRERRDMLVQIAGLTPTSRVLDIGCGTGQMADALADYLTDEGCYFGTDIGTEAIAFCQARFRRPNFQFARGTMTEVPLATSDGLFDVAIFFSVFTHTFLDESVCLLAEARRLLAPTGVIVADVITSPLTTRAAGHRGEMVVNTEHFLRLAATQGFTATVVGRWPWNPHAERLMLTLRPTSRTT